MHLIEPLEARIAPANLAFAVSGGNAQNQSIDDIAVDPAGNTYVTGRFQGTVDFDPGPGVQSRQALAGDTDGFVAKYDGTGALAWVAIVRDSDKTTNPIHLTVSPLGEAFLFSEFGNGGTANVSFADRLGAPAFLVDQLGPPADVYVAKIDAGGTFQWATRYGSTNSAAAESADIAVDGNGGIYLIGKALGGAGASTLSFNARTVNVEAGEQNLFVAKLQDAGGAATVVWASQTTSPGVTDLPGESDLTIAANAAGNVVVRGVTKVPLTFSTPVATVLTQNIFVASLDPAGAWTWVDQWTGGTDNYANVALDSAGSVFVIGDFTGAIDADPGAATDILTSAGLDDFYLAKLDSAGGFAFASQYGNASSNKAGAIAGVDKTGRIYFTGEVGTGPFDVNPSSNSDIVNGSGVILSLGNGGGFVLGEQNVTGTSAVGDQVIVDAEGGLHRAGAFSGQINAGLNAAKQTLASKGATDFFVARYFPGALVAQDLPQPVLAESFALGGTGHQEGGPVLTDAAGNLYLAGLFSGTVDFDRGAGVKNLTSTDPDGNVFIAKYDALGALTWVQQVKMSLTFDANAQDAGAQLALDALGNVYLTTEYDVSAMLGGFTVTNSEPAPAGSSRDILVAKLASDGTPLWVKSIGSAGQNDFADAFAVRASSGDVVLGGEFAGTVDFNPAGGAPLTAVNGAGGQNDGYIVELSAAGAFQWARDLGGAASEIKVNGLGFLSGGDVVASGNFKGTIDFNLPGAPALLTSTTSSAGDKASFAARFTAAAGSVVWKDGFGGTSAPSDNHTRVAISAADEIFLAGEFTGAQDFDPGIGKKILIDSGGSADSNAVGDIFLEKLDANGALLGAVGFGGAGGERLFMVALDGTGSVDLIGKMGQTIDLDPGPGIAKLTGTNNSNIFVSRFSAATLGFNSGYRMAAFDSGGPPPGNQGVGIDSNASGGFWADANGNTYFSGGFVGSVDLDPAGSSPALVSKGDYDVLVVKFKPLNVFDAAHPRTFHDANGDLIALTLTGPGTASYDLVGGAGDLADLAQLSLADTSLASTLTIAVTAFGSGDGRTVAQKILTTQPLEHDLGALTLGKTVTLGDGIDDALVDLHVSGALKTLTLGDIAARTIIQLGDALPYNITTDTTTPDTYNNHPTVTLGTVLGPGVQLDVIGDGVTPHGPGGGGLGNVVIGSWAFPGFIRTTQSIGNFTVLNGDFFAVLQVDSNLGVHLGSLTLADCGTMTISNGSWGSSGSEIEGDVASFDAEAFLLGASLTANSIGTVTVQGGFDGTITTLDPNSPAIPTFTVNSDFTGSVVSAAPLKKLKIKGDFMGSLTAPLIGSITAYSFTGAMDGMGVPTTHITATTGALGTFTATAGSVTDYTVTTPLAFKGFTISNPKVELDTTGLANVHITAASIGNIVVNLKADPKAAGIDLIGIADSTFTATAAGTTRATSGSIGTVAITLAGDAGIGIQNSSFDALGGTVSAPASTVNAQGNLSVKITGKNGANRALEHASFAANSIGTTTLAVNRGVTGGSTLSAVEFADFTATGAIGAMNIGGDAKTTLVDDLKVWAGASIGAVTVRTSDLTHGTLADSAILAGQALAFDPDGIATAQLAKLSLAKLGAVNVSGSLTNTDLVAGSSIGAVTAGHDVMDSLILAGATLGSDFAIGGGNDTYHRAASIAAVTVRGAFARTSIVAGVDPHLGGFGDGDDATAPAVAALTASSSIGPITLSAGALTAVSGTQHYGIEAARITSLKLGAAPALSIASTAPPQLLDLTPAGPAGDNVLVKLFA